MGELVVRNLGTGALSRTGVLLASIPDGGYGQEGVTSEPGDESQSLVPVFQSTGVVPVGDLRRQIERMQDYAVTTVDPGALRRGLGLPYNEASKQFYLPVQMPRVLERLHQGLARRIFYAKEWLAYRLW